MFLTFKKLKLGITIFQEVLTSPHHAAIWYTHV